MKDGPGKYFYKVRTSKVLIFLEKDIASLKAEYLHGSPKTGTMIDSRSIVKDRLSAIAPTFDCRIIPLLGLTRETASQIIRDQQAVVQDERVKLEAELTSEREKDAEEQVGVGVVSCRSAELQVEHLEDRRIGGKFTMRHSVIKWQTDHPEVSVMGLHVPDSAPLASSAN